MKTQRIDIDIYKRSVVIFDSYTEDEVKKWMQEIELESDTILDQIKEVDWSSTLAVMVTDNFDMYIVSKNTMTLPVLCHELSHAALGIMRLVGIDPIEAEEAYAYLYEYLITQVTSSDDALLPLSSDETLHTVESQTGQTQHCD